MQQGQWADVGMFMQNFMLLARESGLDTCAQESWASWHELVREELGIPDEQILFCGMAVGYADTQHPINSFTADREPLDGFATFKGI
jgi:nitroreductase